MFIHRLLSSSFFIVVPYNLHQESVNLGNVQVQGTSKLSLHIVLNHSVDHRDLYLGLYRGLIKN